MKTITIGNIEVPAIGIGTWNIGENPAKRPTEIRAIQAAITAGARVIDTAEMYGQGKSELLIADAIKPYNRKDLFIIDKVLPSNASSDKMKTSLTTSLKRLGTSYVDLYLYHWRGSYPLSETIRALQALQRTGKIKHWGVSNFDVADMEELMQIAGGNQVSANEDLYNLGSRGIEYSLLDWQAQRNIPMIAYTPVGQKDSLGAHLTTNSLVKKVAVSHHVSVYQILLAWTIRNGNVLAIPQSANPVHAVDNFKSGNIKLTTADLALLDEAFPAPTSKKPLAVL